VWFGHGLAFFTQAVEVECDRFSHVLVDFLACPASGNTSREIRGVGRKARLRGLKYFFMTSTQLLS
jgi:hypothetical protein